MFPLSSIRLEDGVVSRILICPILRRQKICLLQRSSKSRPRRNLLLRVPLQIARLPNVVREKTPIMNVFLSERLPRIRAAERRSISGRSFTNGSYESCRSSVVMRSRCTVIWIMYWRTTLRFIKMKYRLCITIGTKTYSKKLLIEPVYEKEPQCFAAEL